MVGEEGGERVEDNVPYDGKAIPVDKYAREGNTPFFVLPLSLRHDIKKKKQLQKSPPFFVCCCSPSQIGKRRV